MAREVILGERSFARQCLRTVTLLLWVARPTILRAFLKIRPRFFPRSMRSFVFPTTPLA